MFPLAILAIVIGSSLCDNVITGSGWKGLITERITVVNCQGSKFSWYLV